MDPAGKRGGWLEDPLVYKVNLRLSVIREETRVRTGALVSPHGANVWVEHLSYNPLNKADPSPPCTQLLIVYSTSLLFCPTPQPFLSLSLSVLSTNSYKDGRIVIMQRKLAATRAKSLFAAFHLFAPKFAAFLRVT